MFAFVPPRRGWGAVSLKNDGDAAANRAARLSPLLPLLEKPGLQLAETGGGNFQLAAFPGLIVKDSYWRWPERELGGNAIDFLVQVLGCSFHDAMREHNPA